MFDFNPWYLCIEDMSLTTEVFPWFPKGIELTFCSSLGIFSSKDSVYIAQSMYSLNSYKICIKILVLTPFLSALMLPSFPKIS